MGRLFLGKETFWGYVFVTPIMLGFLVFMLFPVVFSLYLSFTDWDGITSPNFIGLDNYVELLNDRLFGKTLFNTFYYVAGSVPLGVVIALILAMLLNTQIRFRNWYRTAYFLPVVTSMVAVAVVWQWLYNTDYGLINSLLAMIGIDGPGWLASQTWAMPAIIIMSIWKGLGFNMVIYLAGLQGISPSLYEAAKIDGASALKRFLFITIPLLRHTTFFVVVLAVIQSFQVFDQIYIMTAGGPANSTSVIVYYIYQNAFQYFYQGYASAMAYVLFGIIFLTTVIQLKITQRKDVT